MEETVLHRWPKKCTTRENLQVLKVLSNWWMRTLKMTDCPRKSSKTIGKTLRWSWLLASLQKMPLTLSVFTKSEAVPVALQYLKTIGVILHSLHRTVRSKRWKRANSGQLLARALARLPFCIRSSTVTSRRSIQEARPSSEAYLLSRIASKITSSHQGTKCHTQAAATPQFKVAKPLIPRSSKKEDNTKTALCKCSSSLCWQNSLVISLHLMQVRRRKEMHTTINSSLWRVTEAETIITGARHRAIA